MSDITFKVEGMKDLVDKLIALKDVGEAKRAMRKAARYAMLPVRDMAKATVRKRYGILADSIRTAVKVPKRGDVVLSVGLKVTKRQIQDEVEVVDEEGVETGEQLSVKATTDASWRWHFIELGTSKRRAFPFLRPAFDAKKYEMVDRFKSRLQKMIDNAVKRKRAEAT